MAGHGSDIDRSAEWEALKARYLRPREERPASSAMATTWRTSTSPALTSVNTAKCSEAFITSPFRSFLSSGIGWLTNWKLPESRPTS